MSGLLPFRPEVTIGPRDDAAIIEIEDEEAVSMFDSLSSETAREIFASLYKEPCTPSDLADATGTSLQNIRYHLDKLLDSQLVEVVDTWYSSSGNEMEVYAPSNSAIVIIASKEETVNTAKDALKQMFGPIILLGIASLLVEWVAQLFRPTDNISGGGTGTVESVIEALPPGALFFAGGLFLALVMLTWWYLSR